jgi:general secretion pathway protein K
MSKVCSDDSDQRGFIIVAVLWILAALATLALIYSVYAREAALNFVGHDERLQAEALAESGVELAAYQLTAQANLQPLQGHFSFRQGTAAVSVKFRCENSLIDLNFAPEQVLSGLLIGVGVQPNDAVGYADRIIAWRTPLRAGTNDAEAAIYEATGKSYGPRHGPFQDPNELGLVAGLPGALVDRVLPYVTVYSGRPEVNVLAAPPQVLAALPGLTPDRLQLLVNLRANAPQDVMRAQLGMTQSYITLDPSRANRVTVDVQLHSGRHIRTQATIFLLPRDTEPYRVLSWRNDVPWNQDD